MIAEPPKADAGGRLDWIGGVLSALGLGLLVMAVLQASNWGWVHPHNSPVEPFGFSLTPFVLAAGAVLLYGFVWWERRHEERGGDPLLHLRLLKVPSLRSGLWTMLAQNLILMGVFFTVPLFLQIVQGLDALETGVRMLPASAGLFASAIAGSALAKRFPPKPLVRIGLVIVFVSVLLLLGTIEPELDNASFLIAMGVLGIGMGLVVSQLGNVVQSAVGDGDRSEAGGLQFTAQQLGSSLGTAFLGAIVITGLIAAFSAKVAANPKISPSVHAQVDQRLAAGTSFVTAGEVRSGAEEAGIDQASTDELVRNYEDAQLEALKLALFLAAGLVLASFPATRRLPTRRFDELAQEAAAAPGEGAAQVAAA